MKTPTLLLALALLSISSARADDYRPFAICENVFFGNIEKIRIERSEIAKNLRLVLIDDFDASEKFVENSAGRTATVSDSDAASTNTILFLGAPEVDGWATHLFFEFGPDVTKWDVLVDWGDIIRASETPDSVYEDFRCHKI